MKKLVGILLVFHFLIISPSLIAQQADSTGKKINKIVRKKLIKLPNADAGNAIEIEDSIAGPFNVSLGYGKIKEVKPNDSNDYIREENNSAWFKFTIDYDTVITFDIVPFDSLDDYDFMLFKCAGSNCIDKNGKENFIKINQCWSVCNSKSGMTGLSKYAFGRDIEAGPGPAYVSSIPVKAGETYYLMVAYEDYIYSRVPPAGFTIYFYDYYPKKKPIVLNNIFFETGKAVLKEESFPELNKLVAVLKTSHMVIEIRGHTDNIGDKNKNQLLSEERSKAVVEYLASKNINRKRLFYKGFGSSKPMTSNTTEQGRKKNRRVEFVKVMY